MFRSVFFQTPSRVVLRRTLSTTTATTHTYENIQVQVLQNSVGLIRLHRPKALNALSDALFADLIHAAKAFDADDAIGCMVITGSSKAFAAGADISEMKDRTFDQAYQTVRRRLEGFCRLLSH